MPDTAQPSLLVRAARGLQGPEIPVWFMRQAGRSLPEYRALRIGTSMLEACLTPELAAEITLQPVRRHGVDAAVFFSDIMVPLKLAGVGVEIVPGTGPVVADPVRDAAAVARLTPLDPGRLGPVEQAVRLAAEELGERSLIGFAGAPFTLASYLVEGGPSRDHARAKAFMVSQPAAWHDLCERLADMSTEFLLAQIRAGAQAVQLFDSWAGSLSARDYREFVLPHSRSVLERVPGVPRIHFGVGTGELLTGLRDAGADVVGVDWRVDLDDAARRLGGGTPVQGNLDPALLGAPWPVLRERALDVIARGAAAPGHIFNLGHGVPPDADPDVLTRLVELVHEEGPLIRARVEEQAAASNPASGGEPR